jgi:hypothetical protein
VVSTPEFDPRTKDPDMPDSAIVAEEGFATPP